MGYADYNGVSRGIRSRLDKSKELPSKGRVQGLGRQAARKSYRKTLSHEAHSELGYPFSQRW